MIRLRPLIALIPLVAPFTGAWIEIGNYNADVSGLGVAPFTGAWIEMYMKIAKELSTT